MINRLSVKMVIKMMNKAVGAQGDSFTPSKLKTFFQKEKTKAGTSFSQLIKKKDIDIGDFKNIYQKAQDQGIIKKNLPTAEKQVERLQETQKQESISQASKETAKAERWRGAALGGEEAIRGMERVYAGGKDYRKQQAATSGLLKSRGGGGMAAEGRSGGLVDHAVKEEVKGDSANKSNQKKGGNAPASQKSGGHQPVKLQGSAGIDQLTHRQEISKGENLPGGIYHVKGLDKAPASQSETPSAPRSATNINDITDLDIG